MNEELIDFAKIISEPTRLAILHVLRKESCVGEIWQCLDLPQNLVSHHLKVLRDAGLIEAKKQGVRVIYCLNKTELKTKLNNLNQYLS